MQAICKHIGTFKDTILGSEVQFFRGPTPTQPDASTFASRASGGSVRDIRAARDGRAPPCSDTVLEIDTVARGYGQ